MMLTSNSTNKFLIIFFFSISITSCSLSLKKMKENARQQGYNDGYDKGVAACINEYETLSKHKISEIEKILSSEKENLEKEFETQKELLEQQVAQSYLDGIEQGKEDMSKEISSVITLNEKNKKRKGKKTNWNSVME